MKIQFLGLALLFAFPSYGQSLDKARMDSLFSLIETHGKGMGGVSVFENGKEVYQRSIGWRSLETKKSADQHTKYRIGSISKMFTAAVIMKLIEQDKLAMEAKLDKFFPQIPNSEAITISHLLRHRSGIYNFTNDPAYNSWMERSFTREEMLTKIQQYGSVFSPGKKAEYSNTNYVLLSFIAEEITGKSFPELLDGFIIKPLGLKNTYYGSAIDADRNEALSYTKLTDWMPAPQTDMSIPLGAGGVVSTATDLNVFLNHLYAGKIVSPESIKEMMKIQGGFGAGMFQVPFYEMKGYGHTGGIDGFQSVAFYFPEEKVSVAYLSNGTVMPVNDILIGVLSIYFGKEYELPVFGEALVLSPEELDKYLGVYSSPTFPLKVTISKSGNILMGQASGQPSFPLEAYETDKFKFDQAGLKIEFVPADNKLIIRQGGGEFELKRE